MTTERASLVILVLGLATMVAFHFDMDLLNFFQIDHENEAGTLVPRIQTQTLAGEPFDMADQVGSGKYLFIYPRGLATNLFRLRTDLSTLKRTLRNLEVYQDYRLIGVLPYHESWSSLYQNHPEILPADVTWIRDPVDLDRWNEQKSVTNLSVNNHLPVCRAILQEVTSTCPISIKNYETIMSVDENGEATVFERFSWYSPELRQQLLDVKNQPIESITREEYLDKLESTSQ